MTFEVLTPGAYPLRRHPFYADKDEATLAQWFSIARHYGDAVRVPEVDYVPASVKDQGVLAIGVRTAVLVLKRAMTNQVPYVGIPARCFWWLLADSQGRCIGPVASRLETDVVIEQAAEHEWFGDESIRPLKQVVHRVFHDDGSHHHEFFHPYRGEWYPCRWPYG